MTEGDRSSILCKAKKLYRRSVAVKDGFVRNTMLFDFYGELLTDKQREYYDLHYNEDFSLAEIAEQSGISRQGVWDIIRRAEAAMQAVEDKTGLIRRFEERNSLIDEIEAELSEQKALTASVKEKLSKLRF